MRYKFGKVKDFLTRYERHLSSAALLGGFIIDSLTLKRIDLPFENLIFIGYIFLAGGLILTLNILEVRKKQGWFYDRARLIIPLIVQFAFGGLFSGFTIFYSRSGSLATSWPFLLILVGLLVGNEMFKKQYQRLVFQLTVYFTSLYFFSIFSIPVLVGDMGPKVFIVSGLVSLGLILAFISTLTRFANDRVVENRRNIIISIASVLVVVNVLYFANIIPPIPLSIKHIGVYHSVVKSGSGYHVTYEKKGLRDVLRSFPVVHVAPEETLYAYTAVFAPTKIHTDIYHQWFHWDESVGEWQSVTRVSYPIVGGRDGGYRGYSFMKNLEEGLWRVNVETARGQLLGRVQFEVAQVTHSIDLQQKTL